MKLLKKEVTVKVGEEEKHYTNFYLQLDNGYQVAIKPAFSKDYKSLVVIAEEKE